MPCPDQITHPYFLARERNLIMQNGARGQKHLLQMTSLSSRASSSHCIRCLVFWRMSTKRQQIFAQSSRTFEYLLPTKAALVEHIKRTTPQEGYVWGQSIIVKQVMPSPSLCGWVKSESGWVPFWTALPRAAKAMNVLISCGCSTRYTGRCSCYKKGIVCTALCKCSGHCYGRSNPPTSPSN